MVLLLNEQKSLLKFPGIPAEATFQRTAVIGKDQVVFPGVVLPSQSSNFRQHLEEVKATSRDAIVRLLQQHGGAIVLRGFGVSSAEEFSQLAHALRLGPRPHQEVGRPPRRTVLAKGVSTANEGPPDSPIWVHNEYGWSTIYPSYVLFFALRAPEIGGETPINSGIELASRLASEVPELYNQLDKKGLQYVYRYTWEDNPKSNVGTAVLAAYGQDVVEGDDEEVIKRKVEEEIRKHSRNFEWHPDQSLSVTHRVQAIRLHQPSGLEVFFGNVISAYERARYHNALSPPHLGADGAYHPLPLYGDGSPINLGDLDRAANIVHETRSLVKWENGDVLILDNRSVQHAREPWQGERKILASLWDGELFDHAVSEK